MLKFEINFDTTDSSPIVIKLKRRWDTPDTLKEVIRESAVITLDILERREWGDPEPIWYLEVTFRNREKEVIAEGTLADYQGAVEQFLMGAHYACADIAEFKLESGNDNTVNLVILKMTNKG
jgi:hypothetical protein